jgi:hypothetical protein
MTEAEIRKIIRDEIWNEVHREGGIADEMREVALKHGGPDHRPENPQFARVPDRAGVTVTLRPRPREADRKTELAQTPQGRRSCTGGGSPSSSHPARQYRPPSSPTINADNFFGARELRPASLQLGLKREWDPTECPQWVESRRSTRPSTLTELRDALRRPPAVHASSPQAVPPAWTA